MRIKRRNLAHHNYYCLLTDPCIDNYLYLFIYFQSSIGDVGTIRTKLHERRSQLNREITVEERITQGSKKLSKMFVTRIYSACIHMFNMITI